MKNLVVAMDHMRNHYDKKMLENILPDKIQHTVKKVTNYGATHIMTTPNIAKDLKYDCGLIARLDNGLPNNFELSYNVEDVILLKNVKAVCVTYYPSCDASLEAIINISEEIRDFKDLNLLCEILPKYLDNLYNHFTVLNMYADFDCLKIPYNKDFKKITADFNGEVMILGGSKNEHSHFLEDVENSLNFGGKGVIVGRYVWQFEELIKERMSKLKKLLL